MYFVSFFFALGFAFLDVFITIDAASLGMQELMHYMTAKFALITLLIMGALQIMGRIGDRVFYTLMGSITVGSFIYIVLKGGDISSLEAGVFYAVFVAPFWAIYHIMFATATSDSNIGNEVSLAGTGMTVGMTFGSVMGGFCSQLGLETIGAIIGFGIVGSSTASLIYRAIKTGLIGKLRQSGAIDEGLFAALKRCKYRSVGSFLEGLFNIICGNFWMVYLRLAGISAAGVGIWHSLMVVSKVIVTPFAGSLVNHGKRREMVLGSGLNLLGWTPFLFGAKSFFVLASMNLWAIGTHLFSTGLSSAWYGSRTIAAITVREGIMGVSRVGIIFVLTPVLYADPDTFIKVTIIICALTVVYSALWMRSTRMKGSVLPIENIVMN